MPGARIHFERILERRVIVVPRCGPVGIRPGVAFQHDHQREQKSCLRLESRPRVLLLADEQILIVRALHQRERREMPHTLGVIGRSLSQNRRGPLDQLSSFAPIDVEAGAGKLERHRCDDELTVTLLAAGPRLIHGSPSCITPCRIRWRSSGVRGGVNAA